MTKFEEDLILNNIPEDYDENEDIEEEYFHEYYEQQLIDDLAINILNGWRNYCTAIGISMCERMDITKIRDLLRVNLNENQ